MEQFPDLKKDLGVFSDFLIESGSLLLQKYFSEVDIDKYENIVHITAEKNRYSCKLHSKYVFPKILSRVS